MKKLTLLLLGVWAGLFLSAQDASPIPKLSQQLTDYFNYYPRAELFVMTDKSEYKPGETIWFRAFMPNRDTHAASGENGELTMKLYDQKGKQILRDVFRLKDGSVIGDLQIPEGLTKGNYFLVGQTPLLISPEDLSVTALAIDPAYSDQWVVTTSAKDSISVSGQKNELSVIVHDFSGDVEKNTQIKYQIMNGTELIEKGKMKTDANGKVIIPFTLPAKTNGEPFTCELTDNREEWKKVIFIPSNLDELIVKFYPEGGNLVPGTTSKIGFTAFNKWGMPVNVEGSVVNQDGKSVAMVKSFTKGLGLFSVVNDGNQKYKLVISGISGQNQSFDLPAAKPNGLALSIAKTDVGFISANLIFQDKQKHAVAIVVTHGSNIYWAGDMNIDGVGRIKIPAENLPQGVNSLSVFSGEGQLLAERLVYMDKKQQLKIEVLPEKTSLQSGEGVKVKVKLTDENNQPVSGTFAVAVSDKFRNNAEKQQIEDALLVGTELETPFSLISDAFKGKISNTGLMDVFMIANRIKGFSWSEIGKFNPENAKNTNQGGGMSGLVTDKSGAPVNKAKVSLVNNKNMQLYTTTTNADGRFTFANMGSNNDEDFSVKATDQEGKRELNVTLNKNFESLVSNYIAGYSSKYSLLAKERVANVSYFNNNPDLFVKAPKVIKQNTSAIDNQRKLLASATNILDVIKLMKPYKLMSNQIVFVGSENSFNHQGGALLVVDGQMLGTDVSAIAGVSPLDVDHMNVSTNAMDIQRYTGLNSVGLVEIFLKRGKATETVKKEETNKYDGQFRIPNVFPAVPGNLKHDNRTTLLWIPEQKAGETGMAEFTVTSGKVLSDFFIEVQGISDNGRVGSGNSTITIVK